MVNLGRLFGFHTSIVMGLLLFTVSKHNMNFVFTILCIYSPKVRDFIPCLSVCKDVISGTL